MSKCNDCGSKLVVRGHKCQNCGATVRPRFARLILLGVLGGLVVSVVLTVAQDYSDRIQALFGSRTPASASASFTPPIPDSVEAILANDKSEKTGEIKPDAPAATDSATEKKPEPAPTDPQSPALNTELDHAAIMSVGYLTPAGSLDRTVEDITIEVMGRTAGNFSTPTFIRVNKEADGIDGSLLKLTVVYRAHATVTPQMTRAGIMQAALDIYRKIFAEEMLAKVYLVSLRPTLKVLYAAGREKEVAVANLVLRREVADRIDWPRMTPEKFEKLLREEENFYLHPSLK